MNKLTLAIVRVSRSHQDWTLQLDAINKVIKERNLTPVQWEDFTEKREAYLNQDKPLCVIITEKMTGRTRTRKGFLWALGEVKAKRVNAVLAYRGDRVIRSPIAAFELAQACKETKTEFFSCTEKIDLTSPAGEFQFGVLALMAKYESDVNRERAMDGKAAAKEKALAEGKKWVEGGSPPGWFSQKIIKMRKHFLECVALGWSKRKIAQRFGLNYTTVSKMFRMKDEPWLTRDQLFQRELQRQPKRQR